MSPSEVLEKLYSFTEDEFDLALDLLFDYSDDTFSVGDFDSYDQLLAEVDLKRISSTTALTGLLVCAFQPMYAEGRELSHRAEVRERVRIELGLRGKSPEQVEAILRNL